jgi:hypothetical protein
MDLLLSSARLVSGWMRKVRAYLGPSRTRAAREELH